MITLYPEQNASINAAFNYWRENPDKNPVIALPTGFGKSYVIADMTRRVVEAKNISVLILSHRKEILRQNRDKLQKIFDQNEININIGMYSAGLGERNIGQVTIAGINSVYRKAELFRNVRLIIIDEADLIPPSIKSKTMYIKFISKIPNAKCIGLTATPYRLGTGYIVGDNHIFDDIIVDLTQGTHFNRLVSKGYLTKLLSKKTNTELDAEKEGVSLVGGDYSEKELALKFNRQQITNAAIDEIIEKGKNYKKWLLFAIDIDHAESIADRLTELGIPTLAVHSKMEISRDPAIEAFANGTIRCLVNVNILTVGIDIPDIDLIGLLRPTKSARLYVQIVGRGLRTASGKDHCLVLDFAKVVSTLGPINEIKVKSAKKKKGGGEPIMKDCPDCGTLLPPAVRICPECGYKFEFKVAIQTRSDQNSEIVSYGRPIDYIVDEVFYSKHEKKNSPPSMKVTYRCGISTFNEWICIEHKGWAKYKANEWIKRRLPITDADINSVDSILNVKDMLIMPNSIAVNKGGKYPEIISYKFNENIE